MKRPALLLAALIATPALAEPFQDLDRLEARLVAALDAEIGQPGGPAAPIDRRMKLAQCPKPVEIDPPALGAIALRCAQLGWRIRVPIARLAGASTSEMPRAMAAVAAPVVRRGDPVEMIAASPGFRVSVSGTAQEDGQPGQRIRVRTDPAKPPLYAEVVDMGLVRLPGFK